MLLDKRDWEWGEKEAECEVWVLNNVVATAIALRVHHDNAQLR